MRVNQERTCCREMELGCYKKRSCEGASVCEGAGKIEEED